MPYYDKNVLKNTHSKALRTAYKAQAMADGSLRGDCEGSDDLPRSSNVILSRGDNGKVYRMTAAHCDPAVGRRAYAKRMAEQPKNDAENALFLVPSGE
jgi:hypothetical protein